MEARPLRELSGPGRTVATGWGVCEHTERPPGSGLSELRGASHCPAPLPCAPTGVRVRGQGFALRYDLENLGASPPAVSMDPAFKLMTVLFSDSKDLVSASSGAGSLRLLSVTE